MNVLLPIEIMCEMVRKVSYDSSPFFLSLHIIYLDSFHLLPYTHTGEIVTGLKKITFSKGICLHIVQMRAKNNSKTTPAHSAKLDFNQGGEAN